MCSKKKALEVLPSMMFVSNIFLDYKYFWAIPRIPMRNHESHGYQMMDSCKKERWRDMVLAGWWKPLTRTSTNSWLFLIALLVLPVWFLVFVFFRSFQAMSYIAQNGFCPSLWVDVLKTCFLRVAPHNLFCPKFFWPRDNENAVSLQICSVGPSVVRVNLIFHHVTYQILCCFVSGTTKRMFC